MYYLEVSVDFVTISLAMDLTSCLRILVKPCCIFNQPVLDIYTSDPSRDGWKMHIFDPPWVILQRAAKNRMI